MLHLRTGEGAKGLRERHTQWIPTSGKAGSSGCSRIRSPSTVASGGSRLPSQQWSLCCSSDSRSSWKTGPMAPAKTRPDRRRHRQLGTATAIWPAFKKWPMWFKHKVHRAWVRWHNRIDRRSGERFTGRRLASLTWRQYGHAVSDGLWSLHGRARMVHRGPRLPLRLLGVTPDQYDLWRCDRHRGSHKELDWRWCGRFDLLLGSAARGRKQESAMIGATHPAT